MSSDLLTFRFQTVETKSILIVEADGYEPEVFIPKIINGRIAIINAIPSRRYTNTTDSDEDQHKNISIVQTRSWRMNAPAADKKRSRSSSKPRDSDINCKAAPLANSTPNNVRKKTTTASKEGTTLNENGSAAGASSNDQSSENSLPDPEPMRRAIISTNNIFSNSPIEPLFQKTYEQNLPSKPSFVKKIGNTVITRVPQERSAHVLREPSKELPLLDCPPSRSNWSAENVELDNNPIPDVNDDAVDNVPPQNVGEITAILPSLNSSETDLSKKPNHFYSPKWRRVNPPKHVYGSKHNTRSPASFINIHHIKPSYLSNPTLAPKCDAKISIKRIKTILDKKTTISPRTYKKQLKSHPRIKSSDRLMDTKHLATREGYTHYKNTAFDLLTNLSAPLKSVSSELKENFRNFCVNKASSTNPKYKALCKVPPLKNDDEVRRLRGRAQYCNRLVARRQNRFHDDADEVFGQLGNGDEVNDDDSSSQEIHSLNEHGSNDDDDATSGRVEKDTVDDADVINENLNVAKNFVNSFFNNMEVSENRNTPDILDETPTSEIDHLDGITVYRHKGVRANLDFLDYEM